MKILLLDLETAPSVAYIWQLWDQNVGLHQLAQEGYTLCWSAKWLGDNEVTFDSVKKSGTKRMIRRIHKLLDQADAVVHYNGTKFDIPVLNKEFLEQGLQPPAPFTEIDLLKTSRKRFKLLSHKLDYIARKLGVGAKAAHKGMSMWKACMDGDPEAWAKMEEYNKNDVVILEQVYYRLLPWIKGHANYSVHEGALCCPNCGSFHFQARGKAVTAASVYQRYQCTDCGSWFRGNKAAKLVDKGIKL